MPQRRVDPLAPSGVENVQTVLAVSDQPPFVSGHPFAHVSRAIPMQPLRIGRGIPGQFQRFQIRRSRPRRRGVFTFEEISHGSIYQLARAGIFPALDAVQDHALNFGPQRDIHVTMSGPYHRRCQTLPA